MSDSVRPHRQQPTRLPRPWNSPGKNTGVGCHFLLQCMKVKSESEVAQLCPTLSDPMVCGLPGSSLHGIFQMCVYLNSNLLIYLTCIYRWRASAEGKRHLSNIVGSHCLPHPPRTLSPTTIQPWDSSLPSLQRSDTSQGNHGMKGIESEYVSIFTVLSSYLNLST